MRRPDPETRLDSRGPLQHLGTFPIPSTLARSLALAFLMSLGACGGEAPEPVEVLRPVRTARVEAAEAARPAIFAGVARSGVESRLSFRVSGMVEAVFVKLGDRVRRGQVLARLDPTDLELQVEEAEASKAQAQAALRQAEADYDRVRALYENNNAAKSDLDAARAGAESATAQVEAAGKRLAQARQQLGYAVLRSPLEGAIAAVDVEVNESTQAGAALFLLTSGGEPEVRVAVPEGVISQVREGQEVSVAFAALRGQTFPARVREVGVATVGSATYEVTAILLEGSADIRSGMAADVTFLFPGNEGLSSMQVPLVSVGEDRAGPYVFVLEAAGDGTGMVRRRDVQVGQMVPGGLELLDGIEVGEVVVTAGVKRLSDGQKVKVEAAEASTGNQAVGEELP